MYMEGEYIRLRAIEPEDIDLMYRWENDATVWQVSGTLVPFSRHTLRRFLDEQQFDITQTGQQRFIIETKQARAVGAVDLFGFDPLNARAGIGILIAEEEDRRRGYARDAIQVLCNYGRNILGLHQLWCNVAESNLASLSLFNACGFETMGLKRDWLHRPDGWEGEWSMQKIL